MKESVCQPGATFRQLLVAINAAPAGIAFIVDDEYHLKGVFTDGDFRRHLLAGGTLEDTFTSDFLKPFISARQGETMKELLAKTSRQVRIIPVVDHEGKLTDFFRYEHRTNFTPVAQPDLGGNELNYVTDAVLSTWVSSAGKYIDDFENGFARFCGTRHGVAVANGTVALHLALKALNIGPGDEVILPDLTFAATINAVLYCGATPVIVDVEKESWCIDPAKIESSITAKTRAVIPVHLYGQPCNMDPIMQLAKAHNLFVIEDCAESHGAEYKGRKTGSFGDISCYSFYGNKIITTGEGGICLTDSNELNERMRVLRDHGMSKSKRYWHDEVGFNYRMTNLQAALGCAQLERIDSIIDWREEIEQKYREALSEFSWIVWQKKYEDRKKVTWLVSIRLEENREKLMEVLKSHAIDFRPFFYPLSSMPLYQQYVHSSGVSLELGNTGLNLPTVREIDFDKVRNAFKAANTEIFQQV